MKESYSTEGALAIPTLPRVVSPGRCGDEVVKAEQGLDRCRPFARKGNTTGMSTDGRGAVVGYLQCTVIKSKRCVCLPMSVVSGGVVQKIASPVFFTAI